MWIKELYATFGRLENEALTLAPGLNIISGKNESGKSTWSAFIRAMFFGISTREKARADHLPDKEKYLPWSGAPMYGRMELCRKGTNYTIERTPGRGEFVLSRETITNSEGEPAPTGEALLGIARGVWERTAFIGQARIGIDGDKDTEKRILSLGADGDETVSALEVMGRLEKRYRLLRSPRGGGAIPGLEEEKKSLEDSLSSFSATEEEINRVLESLSVTEGELSLISRSILIAEAEVRKKERAYIEEIRREVAEGEISAEEVRSLPSREDYDSFLLKKGSLQTLLLTSERESAHLREEREKISRLEDKLSSHPVFGGMSPSLAERESERDIRRLEGASKRRPFILSLISALLALACIAGGFIVSPLIFFGGAVLLVVAAGLFILSHGRKKKLKRELSKKYGGFTSIHIKNSLSAYLLLFADLEKAEEEEKVLSDSCASLKAGVSVREEELSRLLSSFGISSDDFLLAQEELQKRSALREKREKDLYNAKIRLEASLNTSRDEEEKLQYTPEEIPGESLEALLERREALFSRRRSLELSLSALRERASGFDKKEAEERLSLITKKLCDLSLEAEALAMAKNVLGEADRELKSRFSPIVEGRASEIFKVLSGGSFSTVRILDPDFDMNVKEGEGTVPRDKLYLSGGTLDELYLALRLALCDTILPKDEPPPMILDDALVNFDDERTKRALTYLKDLARDRQIILFTCHGREAEFFKDDPTVNKISI